MTMIQHIAEVLRRSRVDGGWDDEVVAGKVLREMREPDQTMMDRVAHIAGDDELQECWGGMIDAALAEVEPAHSSSEIGHG